MNNSGEFLNRANTDIAGMINTSPHGEQLMKLLCQIGPRPTGSAAMWRATKFLSKKWIEFGAANVHTEEVPVVAWDECKSQLELIAPTYRSYESLQCINTASGMAEGKLLDVGRGDVETVHQLNETVHGAILLTKGHEISGGKYDPVHKRVCLLEDIGAAGVILVSQQHNLPAIHYMYPNNPITIPVVSVSEMDGKNLAELAGDQDARVRIETEGHAYQTKCFNLVAEIGRKHKSQEKVILSAHLDSFYIAPGAFDNLAGVVTMTEIARSLAPFRDNFTRTLRIIAFTGEEYGFAGSKCYVRNHVDEMEYVQFVLNLDGLFNKTAEGLAVFWSPEMRGYIERALRKVHPEVDVRNHFGMSSDYLSFMLQGIPAGRPAHWQGSFPLWGHTSEDTDDKIPVEWLRSNAIVCARVLLKMLTDKESLPSKQKTYDQVCALLQQENAQDLIFNWLDYSDFKYLDQPGCL